MADTNNIADPTAPKKRGRPPKTLKKVKSLAAIEEEKLTPAKMRARISELQEEITKLKEDSGFCYMCGKIKPRAHFFMSTDPLIKSGITPICKQCAYGLANRQDAQGKFHTPTRESIILALRYLNKPFLETIYNSAIQKSAEDVRGAKMENLWSCYIKVVSMKNYAGLTFADSDHLVEKTNAISAEGIAMDEIVKNKENFNTQADFMQNKGDVVRLLTYDPFAGEALEDQPFLYSQLVGLLDNDENGNDDMMRVSAAISIVRSLLQQSKIDDAIARLMSDFYSVQANSGQIKSLQETKLNLTRNINSLAAENCISLKNSKTTKKGENTWTGKIKKIKDLNLREGEINGFDLATCKGMQQVMDLSNASILKQLRLDESEYAEIVATQREKLVSANNDLMRYKEINRILLRENIDLKDLLVENRLLRNRDIVDLEDLYSVFSENAAEEYADDFTVDVLETKDGGGSG